MTRYAFFFSAGIVKRLVLYFIVRLKIMNSIFLVHEVTMNCTYLRYIKMSARVMELFIIQKLVPSLSFRCSLIVSVFQTDP